MAARDKERHPHFPLARPLGIEEAHKRICGVPAIQEGAIGYVPSFLALLGLPHTEPVTSVYDCRQIGSYPTTLPLMRAFVDKVKAMEGKDGILSISVAHCFPYADVPEMGTKVLVYTDDRKDFGDQLAEKLGRELWDRVAKRELKADDDLTIYRRTLSRVLANFGTALPMAMRYVGGVYTTRAMAGAKQPLLVPVPAAQQRAALSVNRELVELYWQIGRDILARQSAQGWGAKVIDRLAHDLRTAFPDMKGFSRANLLYMRAFAEAWPDMSIVQQAVGQLPWGHNLVLLAKLKSAAERLAYAQRAIEHGWSRNVLTQLATANIDLANAAKLGRAAQDLAVVANINSSEALSRVKDIDGAVFEFKTAAQQLQSSRHRSAARTDTRP